MRGLLACCVMIACQHGAASRAPEPPTDAHTDSLRACTAASDCVQISLVPNEHHSGCSISVNRAHVDEWYRDVFEPNAALFRELVVLTNCGRGPRRTVCVDGRCCFETSC